MQRVEFQLKLRRTNRIRAELKAEKRWHLDGQGRGDGKAQDDEDLGV